MSSSAVGFRRLLAGLVFPLLFAMGASAQSVQPVSARNEPPLAKRVLDSAWPTDADALAIDSATLDQLGLHDDAHRLNDAWQRRAIASLRGRVEPTPVTLRAAIAQEAAEREPLERARSALASEGVSVDFTDQSSDERPDPKVVPKWLREPQTIVQFQPGIWGGFYERAMGTSRQGPTDAPLLLMHGLVRNRMTAAADIRINVALHDRVSMVCNAEDVPAKTSADAFCIVWGDRQRSKSIKVAEALVTGRLAPHIVGLRLDTGPSRPVLSMGEAAELPKRELKDSAAVIAAKRVIAQSSCWELGSCGRIAMGWVFNPGTISMLMLGALMAWTARRRWLRAADVDVAVDVSASQSWFRGAFKLYCVLTCIGLALAMIDLGFLSGLYDAVLALPWSFLQQMQADALPNAAMRDETKGEMARLMFFIVINLSYLGFMGYSQGARGPSRRRPKRDVDNKV